LATTERRTDGRVPPNNLQAEESLLGAMMLSRVAASEAASIVTVDDFYKPAHGHVFEAVVGLASQGEPVDVMTVQDVLNRRGLLDAAGGPGALVTLISNTPAVSNAPTYARIVSDHSMLRRLIGVAREIVELAHDTPEDVPEAIDRAEAMVYALTGQRRQHETVLLSDTLNEWLDRLEQRFTNGDPDGVLTGWADVDALLLGLHPGQLVTIAGRPAMGKSATGAALAVNVARRNLPVLFVSVEMSLPELQDRFGAATASVDLQKVRKGDLTDKDWARVSQAIGVLSDIPLYVEDDPGATVLSIRSSARRVASRHGGLGLVIVDYLQLVDVVGKVENRQVAVAEISRGLKKMALELKVPVVALAQLHRGVEVRSDKRPMLSDLRESGEIENSSDVVAFLFRDEYYKADSPDKGILEFIVAKQRNGPTGTVKLHYEANYGRIRDLAKGM
jgi:replicative DNA helicase